MLNLKFVRDGGIAAFLMAGMMTLAPSKLQAQAVKVNFALTATYQRADVTTGPDQNITKSSTKAVKWTSASMLNLLATSQSTTFPAKSYFALDNGSISVMDPTSATSGDATDVGSAVTVDLTDGATVYSGSANSDTSSTTETYTIYASATFDDGAGNAFNVSGLVKETVSIPALTAAGSNAGAAQNETISFSGTFSGSGTVLGNTAVFSGTLSGSGKGSAGS